MRRDEDNAICSPRTVNSCGGGVFQDIYTFDVNGIDITNRSGKRNTIQYNQWVVARIQRACTPDTYLHSRPRFRGSLCHLNPRNTSLQGLCNVRRRHFIHLFSTNRGYRASHRFFPLCTITDDNHLIHGNISSHHSNFQRSFIPQRVFPRFKTDIRKYQDGTWIYVH